MLKIALNEVHSAMKDIPNGEFFLVHAETMAPQSAFLLTANASKVQAWNLALKIKDQLYTADWWTEATVNKNTLNMAMRRLMNIKLSGWYLTDEKRLDDEIHMFHEPIYRCAYCQADTTNPVGKCVCRAFADSLRKKVPSHS